MASHYDPYSHHHHHQISHSTTASCSCCCCTTSTPSHHPTPPDPLLHSIVHSHLHHSPPQLYSPYHNLPHPQHSQTQYYPPPPPPYQHKHNSFDHHHLLQEEDQVHPTISSLLRRISALESSLHRHSSTASFSLREAAARTIQIHFRAFLVRRSQTLRQLKGLAFIKSSLSTLKSCVSDNTHFDSQALSLKVMDLLLKLDSFQGSDPMIRNGKRSIRRELINFMELIDGFSVKRNGLSSRVMKNVRYVGSDNKSRVLYSDHIVGAVDFRGLGRDKTVLIEKMRDQVEKSHGFSRVSEGEEDEKYMELEHPSISVNGKCGVFQNIKGALVKRHGGVEAKVKKNVRFAENGTVYRILRRGNEPISIEDCNSSDGNDSGDSEGELVDNLGREIEEFRVSSKETEDDEEICSEDRASSQISNGERQLKKSERNEDKYEPRRHLRDEDVSFVFSAPLPVKMEMGADLMNKRKTVKMEK